jgi:integron integrase
MPLPPHFQKALDDFGIVAARKLALTTEASYRTWITKYLHFLNSPEARAIDKSERKFEVFLSRMAREDYSKISQDQAFNAILFLYRHVFKRDLHDVNALRCRKTSRERYTPTQEEIFAMLRELRDTPTYRVRLAVGLLYGCGLRVSECCQLRIKDIDFARGSLTVYEGKGDKDRQVAIPDMLIPALERQIARATALAEIDIAEKQPVQLPGRLDISRPSWQFQTRWHFLFPSPQPCPHPRTKKIVRWCIGPDVIQRSVKSAAERAGVQGKVTPHCLRHSYATHLLDRGESIKRIAEAMGHTDIRTTAGYARKECLGVKSPLDNILRFPKSA